MRAMELYDKIIGEILELVESAGGKTRLNIDKKWDDEKEQKLIFQKDMAYELGGGSPQSHISSPKSIVDVKARPLTAGSEPPPSS